ncbi:dihydrofolate reductase family protein [Ktedonospora formicarum]|uniref:Riboflavin biosynthesis protein RibD n=1 Tax=Ktedonospora formicarum TaxID=2778364 RepID=A0A8J3I660_9CHLR|nr:dihydrofolate reductase family protein [Ktedonospora formicarum]GHO48121.1 riboflavin biosynthesis protein RibD [Ktedonospora formicarum]
MRKVVSLIHISLDGYAAGPNGELEWAIVDKETSSFVDGFIESVDTAIYGRITYQMMKDYWPTVPSDPESTQHDLDHSRWVEDVTKVVFSRTLDAVDWNNTTLVRDHYADAINSLKHQEGGDIMIFGSPRLVHVLAQDGLIDEYVINLNPLLLGGGTPFFKDIQGSASLKLVTAKQFHSGVVGLHYQSAG